MGAINLPYKAMLFAGILYTGGLLSDDVAESLERQYGPVCLRYDGLDFDLTDFYAREMGEGIKRAFCFFERLIPMADLADIKVVSNRMEEQFLGPSGRRTVNIDPGYMDMSKVVLATTKDRGHRVYLRDGIYAESELVFAGNSYGPLQWTYPDYRTDVYIKIFNEARKIYKKKRLI